jgi:hypothetical protein
VINGLIKGGIGIDMPTESFDIASDFTDLAAFGALEEHVLVEVGKAFFAGALIGAAYLGPDLEFDDGGAVALAKQDLESVREHFIVGAIIVRAIIVSGIGRSGGIGLSSGLRGQGAARVPEWLGRRSRPSCSIPRAEQGPGASFRWNRLNRVVAGSGVGVEGRIAKPCRWGGGGCGTGSVPVSL